MMGKKKYILIGIIIMAIIACAGFFSTHNNSKTAKPIVLRAADMHPEDYPTALATKRLAEMVEQQTNGRVKIKLYAGGKLGSGKIVRDAAEDGMIDIIVGGVDNQEKFSLAARTANLPYVFQDAEHEWKAFDGAFGQKLRDEIAANTNKVVLTYYDAGQRCFYSSKPFNAVTDLQGQNIRGMSTDIFKKTLSLLQAKAVNVGFDDIYPAIQMGKIDGAENNIPSYYTGKHYEVAPYYIYDEHTAVPEMLLIMKASFDKISPEDQKIILECSAEAGKYQRQLWKEFSDKAKHDMESKGVKFIKADKTQFTNIMQSIYAEHAESNELIKEIQSAR